MMDWVHREGCCFDKPGWEICTCVPNPSWIPPPSENLSIVLGLWVDRADESIPPPCRSDPPSST